MIQPNSGRLQKKLPTMAGQMEQVKQWQFRWSTCRCVCVCVCLLSSAIHHTITVQNTAIPGTFQLPISSHILTNSVELSTTREATSCAAIR
jgi:hypothetical protein